MSELFAKSMSGQWIGVFLIGMLFMTFSQFAEAKRFGGGKSFGYQKQVAPKSFNTSKTKKQDSSTGQTGNQAGTAAGAGAAGTAAKSGASKWLGPLAGIAAGGLLAAMIFGDGFEGMQILDILIFALIAFLLFKLFMGKKRQSQQSAYEGYQAPQSNSQHYDREETLMQRQSQAPQEPVSYAAPAAANASQPAYDSNAGGSIFGADLGEPVGQAPSEQAQTVDKAPEWFDAEGFVEGAKNHFVQIQAAWDRVDMDKLAEYCTEELMQALTIELEGVQPGQNLTHVDELQAEIAQMAIEDDYFIVSVRYSGFIDEDAEGVHAFSEVWHIRRLAVGEGSWQVAGIQQSH